MTCYESVITLQGCNSAVMGVTLSCLSRAGRGWLMIGGFSLRVFLSCPSWLVVLPFAFTLLFKLPITNYPITNLPRLLPLTCHLEFRFRYRADANSYPLPVIVSLIKEMSGRADSAFVFQNVSNLTRSCH